MKYVPGLLKANLNKWVGKKWYHQRFDGSPYFMHIISEAEIWNHNGRKKGAFNAVHYCFFSDGKADWYILMDDIERISKRVIEEGKKNKNFSSDLMKLWDKDQELFYKKCIEVGKTNLGKLSDEELIQLHDEFLQIAINKNRSSSIIDGFALGTDNLIADKIKEVYDKSDIKGKMRFTEVFSILTAPVHLSFINEAEIALLKVALEIKKGRRKEKQILGEHQKRYFWIRNNYVDDIILPVGYFKEEIGKVLAMKLDIKKEIERVENTPNESRKKKQELMKSLELSDELKYLIKVSEDFTYWQDERKKSTFWTTHYFSLILREISKRVNIGYEYLKYLSPREMREIFEKKPNDLKERKKSCVFYWDINGHECLSGKDVEVVREKILGDTKMDQVDDFRGLTASMGKAIGKARILRSSKEIGKVQKGDIIVAVMTRPDYVPAMKIASAIVTDEGGVTCHAAIVSRELGIPCIIGTKIATKVLKDGQLVEVNANHGWVKIIKSDRK